MNERIKELAKQAGFKTFAGPDIWAAEPDHPDDKGRVDNELQKFAELIVRECARVDSEMNNPDHVDGKSFNYTILEHFGVK
jgi:hypothetical protein